MDVEEVSITCRTCDMTFTSIPDYTAHTDSKKHKKKLKATQSQKESVLVASRYAGNIPDDDHEDEELSCEVCEKVFSGIISYVQHMESGTHMNQVKRLEMRRKIQQLPGAERDINNLEDGDTLLPEPFATCHDCGVPFSGPQQYMQHMKSKKHKKALKVKKLCEKLKASKMLPASTSKGMTKSVSFKSEKEDASTSRQSPNIERSFQKKDETDDDDSSSSSEEDMASCELCNRSFYKAVDYSAHMSSDEHRKNKKTLEKLQRKELNSLKSKKTKSAPVVFSDPDDDLSWDHNGESVPPGAEAIPSIQNTQVNSEASREEKQIQTERRRSFSQTVKDAILSGVSEM